MTFNTLSGMLIVKLYSFILFECTLLYLFQPLSYCFSINSGVWVKHSS